jgi:hypothetical protein
LRELVALDPRTPLVTLATLIYDEYPFVAYAALTNPELPLDAIHEAADSRAFSARGLARVVLVDRMDPSDPARQLLKDLDTKALASLDTWSQMLSYAEIQTRQVAPPARRMSSYSR